MRELRWYLLMSVLQAHTGRPCQDIEDANLRKEHLIEEAMSKCFLTLKLVLGTNLSARPYSQIRDT